jgi:hypothetical protein
MKSKLLLKALLVSSISLVAFSASAGGASQRADFRGSAAPSAASADKIIVITPATKFVNVESGTTVRFVVGGQAFNWHFDTVNGSVVPFDLQQIAPQGMVAHPVTVYVAENPLYRAG